MSYLFIFRSFFIIESFIRLLLGVTICVTSNVLIKFHKCQHTRTHTQTHIHGNKTIHIDKKFKKRCKTKQTYLQILYSPSGSKC